MCISDRKKCMMPYTIFFITSTLTLILNVCISTATVKECLPRVYGKGRMVCVCNEAYCDSLGSIHIPQDYSVNIYESNILGARFHKINKQFTTGYRIISHLESLVDSIFTGIRRLFRCEEAVVVVDATHKYQKIIGFGGSFTDSAGININSLSANLQNEIIRGYYSADGLDYNMGRVPMASTVFSTRQYSYCDVLNDFSLLNFALTKEDFNYKIPYLKMAQYMSKKPLLFFASPWSSPYWMKTNNQTNGSGVLKGLLGGPYYQTWANYFVKFLKAYEENKIKLWGITAQNAPTDGYISNFPYQCLGFTPQTQRDFIKLDLGPSLQKAGYGPENLNLMIMDDKRSQLPIWPNVVLADPYVNKLVSGIAVHWNNDSMVPPNVLDITHKEYPKKFILSSEAHVVGGIGEHTYGSWNRAENYAHDIMEDLLHYGAGWVDWNLALDPNGGPNWVNENFVDSPVIVNKTGNEFFRQPIYYALGHFSKFLPKGTYRIGFKVSPKSLLNKIKLAAFQRPDKAKVLIALNRNNEDVSFTIKDPHIGKLMHKVAANSIQSYIWSRPTKEETYKWPVLYYRY